MGRGEVSVRNYGSLVLVGCAWLTGGKGGDLYNILGKLLYSLSSREGWIPYYMVTLGQDGMESGWLTVGDMGAVK